MIMANNPFGRDPIDFDEETAASRVGTRIRNIREARGMSQTELGARVGLTADRIQKYENGARKPKTDLLKRIAGALGVSSQALSDPNTTTYIGAIFALFEIEDRFGLKLARPKRINDNDNDDIILCFDTPSGVYDYIDEWYKIYEPIKARLDAAETEEEKSEILKEYNNWKWNFPLSIPDTASKVYMKKQLKSKIEELQKLYDDIDV